MSESVQSAHVPELLEETRKGKGWGEGRRYSRQKGKRLKKKGRAVTKVFGLYREEPLGRKKTNPWAGEFEGKSWGISAIPCNM